MAWNGTRAHDGRQSQSERGTTRWKSHANKWHWIPLVRDATSAECAKWKMCGKNKSVARIHFVIVFLCIVLCSPSVRRGVNWLILSEFRRICIYVLLLSLRFFRLRQSSLANFQVAFFPSRAYLKGSAGEWSVLPFSPYAKPKTWCTLMFTHFPEYTHTHAHTAHTHKFRTNFIRY